MDGRRTRRANRRSTANGIDAAGADRNDPELLNADPHGEAWLIRVEVSDRREIEKLMTADEYEAYLKKEKAH